MGDVKKTGCKLRELLHSIGYLPIIESLTLGNIQKEPWTLCPASAVDALPSRVSSLIRLCHWGESITDPHGILGADLAGEMVNSGILQSSKKGEWSLGGKVLIPYQGLFILCDFWDPSIKVDNEHVWFGGDSTWLTRVLPFTKSRKVLDLCTGTGIQGLVMAARGNCVTAVDINGKATRYAHFNGEINDLSESFKVIQGNVFEPVLGVKYDLIIANPPFLPSLKGLEEEVFFVSGGTDGERIQNMIIEGLQEHLTQKGEAMILSGGFGDSDFPFVTSRLSRYAQKNNWKVNFIINTCCSASEKIIKIAINGADKLGRDAMATDLVPGATHYYSYLMHVQKDHIPGEVHVNKCNVSIRDVVKDIRNKKKGLIY